VDEDDVWLTALIWKDELERIWRMRSLLIGRDLME